MNATTAADKRKDREIVLFFIAAGIASLILFWVIRGVFSHLGEISARKIRKVTANLKQIETAKQMWARDHAAAGTQHVTLWDLRSYLPPHLSNDLSKSVMGERYVINPIGVLPEALIRRTVGELHSEEKIQLGPAAFPSTVTALPNQQGRANSKQPSRSTTNSSPAAAGSRR